VLVHPEHGSNVLYRRTFVWGPVQEDFARAEHTLSFRVRWARNATVPIETFGVAAQWHPGTGLLDVWASIQMPKYPDQLAKALKLPGKGRMKTTGKLGDVMKESIEAAASYVRSISPELGVKPPKFEAIDIHVHVPEGATPKDGPSAGLAMVTSIVSVLTGIPVRKDIAMTGEVTLRGNALAIGGLKEKLLAALRGGIKTVLIPEENAKDLPEIPENVRNGLTIIPVSHVKEVLKLALVRTPEPVEWDEAAEEAAAAAAKAAASASPSQIAH
jgi:ATP-dependent Lon protease